MPYESHRCKHGIDSLRDCPDCDNEYAKELDDEVRKIRAELENLRAENKTMRKALEVIRDNHVKDRETPAWCAVCGSAGGRWPCATRLEADAALKGASRE